MTPYEPFYSKYIKEHSVLNSFIKRTFYRKLKHDLNFHIFLMHSCHIALEDLEYEGGQTWVLQ